MYSVLILTKNEEVNIANCLDSLHSDDVFILDSYSTDHTVAIAKSYAVNIEQRVFDNYAAQRNHGLSLGTFKYPWVFTIDADERMTIDLHLEILERIRTAKQDVVMYRVRRKDIFMGRWLKRSSGYPTWIGGLMRLGYVSVQREINEEYVCNGEVDYLSNHTIHFPFAKGLSYWVERHNKYSDMEAVMILKEVEEKLDIKGIFSKIPSVRRKNLKQLAYRMPMRPLLVFNYLYFFRGGIFDGYPGFVFCILRSYYEFLINIKAKMMKQGNKEPIFK